MGCPLFCSHGEKPFFFLGPSKNYNTNRKKTPRSVLGTDPARSSFLATPQHIDKSGGEDAARGFYFASLRRW